jgi:hypothetical protein
MIVAITVGFELNPSGMTSHILDTIALVYRTTDQVARDLTASIARVGASYDHPHGRASTKAELPSAMLLYCGSSGTKTAVMRCACRSK